MPKSSLLLPVETLNREFDGKLLLALHAARRGWDTTIGQRNALDANLGRYSRSVYFAKGLRTANLPKFRMIAGLGHDIVALDEEGLVTPSDELYLARADSEALRKLSMIFTWGPDSARLVKLAGSIGATPVVSTGNPRVDMLRPELRGFYAPEVERIRERYGHFALMNTNFGLVNRYSGTAQFRVADWVSSESAASLKSDWFGHKAQLMQAFLELLPRLARALAPVPLVVRPHPSEDATAWTEAARDLPNVHVVYQGSVVPWLAAARVLIHNGCTTAIEAAILGTPALAYRPSRRPGFDNELPNGVSREYEAPEALIAAAVEASRPEWNGPEPLDPARQELLRQHVSALDGPLACSRLLDEIERLEPSPSPAAGQRLAAHARLARRRAKRALRQRLKRLKRAKQRPSHREHRFPHIEVAEVKRRVGQLNAVLGESGEIRTDELERDLFRITCPDAAPRRSHGS